jgi:hypothetical protein
MLDVVLDRRVCGALLKVDLYTQSMTLSRFGGGLGDLT